jgi:hypothetical protein
VTVEKSSCLTGRDDKVGTKREYDKPDSHEYANPFIPSEQPYTKRPACNPETEYRHSLTTGHESQSET